MAIYNLDYYDQFSIKIAIIALLKKQYLQLEKQLLI